MGKSNKKRSDYKTPRDIKESYKNKSRQVDQQFSRRAYNSLETDKFEEDNFDDYSGDLNFEKFTKPNAKRKTT
tara:strand:+ start:1501 stop:1719 length:219 start_codon:yes stop_codon:yes gene_type:complete